MQADSTLYFLWETSRFVIGLASYSQMRSADKWTRSTIAECPLYRNSIIVCSGLQSDCIKDVLSGYVLWQCHLFIQTCPCRWGLQGACGSQAQRTAEPIGCVGIEWHDRSHGTRVLSSRQSGNIQQSLRQIQAVCNWTHLLRLVHWLQDMLRQTRRLPWATHCTIMRLCKHKGRKKGTRKHQPWLSCVQIPNITVYWPLWI